MTAKQETLNNGQVKISVEVISIIASIAASEIEGVNAVASGFVDGLSSLFSKKNYTKGIKVELKENDATIDMSITVDYGFKIQDIATKVQSKVKREVENMTGLNVTSVSVNIQNVVIPKEEAVAAIEDKEEKDK
ncbi:MAG: Asp23/Gls24 family envelope stress response protein [Tissierellales bacterium]|nr:Asp23/Gls24 family envelope stress response protein [Tissierellales bacterium]MBN2826888.1 Asp23/Gls24 family envelope stress response protein [Tissierellales bacterium]